MFVIALILGTIVFAYIYYTKTEKGKATISRDREKFNAELEKYDAKHGKRVADENFLDKQKRFFSAGFALEQSKSGSSIKIINENQLDDKKPCPNCNAINWKESLRIVGPNMPVAVFFIILGIIFLFATPVTAGGSTPAWLGSFYFAGHAYQGRTLSGRKKMKKILVCGTCETRYEAL